jgi:beta-lactamase superfamily II metal-dependent hydrolase
MRFSQNKLQKNLFGVIVFVIISLAAIPFNFASVPGEIKVLINGQERNFSPEPVILKGSTLIPMRSFFEALGCEVNWVEETKTAIGVRGDITVEIPIGKNWAFVNGAKKELPVSAQIIKNSTFIPLRFVGESLGDEVNWTPETRTITVQSTKISSTQNLNVHFIDVGQADSIYIQAPNRYDILIDAGNNADGEAVIEYLKEMKVDDIEIMVATHNHEDHIGGLDDVLAAFEVEKIIDSGAEGTTKTYQDYRAAVEAEEASYQEDADLVFNLGPDLNFFIIETGDNYKNVNNNSVLTKLVYKEIEFLFTGDMESDVELTLLDKNIEADILKVGHHGSRTSTSIEFLNKVNPQIAVISVGKDNTYGHPAPEILKRLEDRNIRTYRTDTGGTVVITTDGNTYTVAQPYSSIILRN